MSALPPHCSQTVDGPLRHWAGTRPDAAALSMGGTQISFRELAQRVADGASVLDAGNAPPVCWIDAAAVDSEQVQRLPGLPDSRKSPESPASPESPITQLSAFLSIVASGRCAAVGSPDWPAPVRLQVLERMQRLASEQGAFTPAGATAQSPFYIGFTSGSSGVPKGFRRSHLSWTSSFEIFLETFGSPARQAVLVPGSLSHSLFLFGAMLGLWTGAGVHLQQGFSAAAALTTLASGAAGALVAVPSQLILMLELAQRRNMAPIVATRLILIGGAPWNRVRTAALRQLFPQARIIEFYGASETSFITWTDSDPSLPDTLAGRPFGNVELRITPASEDELTRTEPTATQIGLIHVRSPMVFLDYVTVDSGQDSSAAWREDGWLTVRDVGYLDEQGLLHLLGREQRMLLVSGKNLFPEEVENVLATHPAVQAASVFGTSDAVRGVRVAALLSLASPVTSEELTHWCRNRLEAYKIPRRFYLSAAWPLTGSGKTDHKQLLSAWQSCPAADRTSLP